MDQLDQVYEDTAHVGEVAATQRDAGLAEWKMQVLEVRAFIEYLRVHMPAEAEG